MCVIRASMCVCYLCEHVCVLFVRACVCVICVSMCVCYSCEHVCVLFV